MKVTIPDALKASQPQSMWGRILAATPVVMTVVATMLAGLSSSEMTRAQYDRSLAAQEQSKAGDQWNFFQAKRLRGALQRNALDMLASATDLPALNAPRIGALAGGTNEALVAALTKGSLPATAAEKSLDQNIQRAIEAVENGKPDADVVAILANVKPQTLDSAMSDARDAVLALDSATKPVNQAVENAEQAAGASGDRATARAVTAGRLRYTANRYDAEARLNQRIANLYELLVRKGNISAEHHHARSQRFFYGMLAGQAAVIIATFAMAARQKNLLWSIAAAAGLAAIALAVYVYLYV